MDRASIKYRHFNISPHVETLQTLQENMRSSLETNISIDQHAGFPLLIKFEKTGAEQYKISSRIRSIIWDKGPIAS